LLLIQLDTIAHRIQAAKLGGAGVLPITLNDQQVAAAVHRVLQRLTPYTAKLLAVDDDPEFLQILRKVLEPQGFHLTTVTDPQCFWDVLQATQPDLLLLDVEMPTVSGIDLCRVLLSDPRYEHLPILFLTAHQDDQTVTEIFSLGADDCVSKPIHPEQLVARILNRLRKNAGQVSPP
jgi:DNA-binding response OmpR family regulator